jgi:hypothetical protein
LLTLGLLLALVLPSRALADGNEPLLWLAIQRGTSLDRVASELVREQLVARKDVRLVEASLADADRRCRTSPCLAGLARQHQAFIVLSGDIFQLGSKQNLRVVMHLYDGRHRQVFDVENLCGDCDETKLGLLVQTTLGEIIGRYHKGQDADAQLNELLDGASKSGPPAIPAPSSDPVMVPPLPGAPAPTTAGTPPSLAATSAPTAVQPAPTTRPQLAAMPPSRATAPASVQLAPTPVGASSPYQSSPMPVPPPLPPLGGTPPLAGSYAPQLPGSPQLSPQPSQYQQMSWPPQQPAQQTPQRQGLSGRRKALAAVLGTLGVVALGGTIAAHYFDKKLDASLAINPGGLPCSAASNAGRSCVLSTIGLWAPGYAVSGLLLGGMILSLAIPEK